MFKSIYAGLSNRMERHERVASYVIEHCQLTSGRKTENHESRVPRYLDAVISQNINTNTQHDCCGPSSIINSTF